MSNIEEIRTLGWNDYISKDLNIDSYNALGRVITVDRELFTISTGKESFKAKISGKIIYKSTDSSDYPCVGDWVIYKKELEDDLGIIQSVIDRKSIIRRKIAGKTSDYQLIAANVDYAIIIQSCHYDFNINRLERYLVMVSDGGVTPIILLTKTDLVTPEELKQIKDQIQNAGINNAVMTISNVTGEGIASFKDSLIPMKTYCFIGSSGVGKSTLINNLTGKVSQITQSVSSTGEGRHTTVRRELIKLSNGAILIDNPGMREFGILGAEDGLEESYSDIEEIAVHCKFNNCTHTREPGCAILNALQTGEIDKSHFSNYLKLRAESEFNNMSYFEKRQKDKSFGKYVKGIKKGIKRRKGEW